MFTHLHIQSGYSLLNSTVKIDELVTKAKADGMESLALCDRNVMYGSLYFYKACKKYGIKPIIGLLADVLDQEEKAYPLLLLAINQEGYHHLLKISSAIQTKSPQGLPRNWLKAYAKGLIAISPGADGKIERLLEEGKTEEAKEEAKQFLDLFGPQQFYVSIQRLQIQGEDQRNTAVEQLAREMGIKVVVTNPVYYLEKDDALAQEVLLAVGTGHKLDDEERQVFPSQQFYLKSMEEMLELFADKGEALQNTQYIAAQCQVNLLFQRALLPKYPTNHGVSSDEMLEAICFEGLKRKKSQPSPQYEERLRYELDVIKRMKFSDYFLIVWDFMKFARENQILTGPGRGSAAGSMVAYVLQITNVDPIEHSLLFERFLNPERVTMPDIDIDFPDHRREEVIEYVVQKYGELHVAQIITFGTMAAKAALRDTGRVFGLDPKEQETLSKMIPNRLGITLKEAYQESKRLQAFVQENERYQMLFSIAMKLEGLPRHTSTHAAGVIISDIPLTDIIPIQTGHAGIYLTQFPMDLLEEIGLLKMDFLGLRNLTLMEQILTSIEKGTGKKIDLAKIPMDDQDTFTLFSKGETTGVFQFESEGIRKVLVKLKPTNFEDIVAVNALYRPGPMENIPQFIERKHGLAPIDYHHPDLQEILESTYGVIVYQEQIIQIASKLAGFSLGEADLLRRAVSKKKKEILDKERNHFVIGAKNKDYSDKIASSIYNLIVRFANYGFNRSHAVAYSVIAYQLAYLKAHYPAHFMAALMTSAIGNEDKIAQYVREAKKKGMMIQSPSINRSTYPFIARQDGIQYSLGAIKGIGRTVLREIFSARRNGKFSDLFDFCLRVSGKIVTRKVLEVLIHSGAFDEFGRDRATLLASLDVALHHAELVKPDEDLLDLLVDGEFSLKPKYVEVEPIRLEDKLQFEKNVLGLYLSNHPVSSYQKLFKHFGCISIEEATRKKEAKALLGVYISAVKTIRTKKGEMMAFLTISDEDGDLEAVVFPNSYRQFAETIQTNAIVMLQGTLEERDGKLQLNVQQIYSIDEAKQLASEETGTLFIKIESDKQTKDILLQIKKILLQYNGKTKVMLYYERENRYVQLSLWDWVQPNDRLHNRLIDIVGNGNVILKRD
ncbi:DNA polymerase III subunit alpha [Peribacillus asahii]|uniref:DNA polymerase III subunit alpha n=1 Tax=Peribacillus asahii TaxID=228899 RepID=UPI00380D7F58